MNLRMRKSWIACACALTAACGGGERAAAGPVVRDSAGIEIVQNGGPAWGERDAWRVAAEPALEVGVGEGDARYQFAAVADALRLSDGTLVVADGQAQELRAFDAAGRWIRTMGKKGGGPGEFNGLSSLFLLPGDTVAAHDYQAGRVTFFAPDGSVARAVTLRPVDGTLPPRPLGVLGDGSFVVAPMYNPVFNDSPEPSRDSITFALYSPSGEQTGSIGRFPGEETITVIRGGQNSIAMRPRIPFGGNTMVAASGARLLVADNARYEIAEHGRDGGLTRLIRRSAEPEPVTEEDRRDFRERQLARTSAASRFRDAQAEMLKSLPFPERKSWFQEVRLDPEGNAWVQRHAAPGGDTPWDVFDPAGRFLGTVDVPSGLRVTQIGAGFVVGAWLDELDVPRVRVHRIEKPGRG